MNAIILRGLALLVIVLLALGRADAAETNACSLTWPPVIRNFSPEHGWAAGPAVPLTLTDPEQPDYQAQLFQSDRDGRTALVIAEWGDPDSTELGAVVYCAVRDREGHVLEEVGRNPLEPPGDQAACNDPDDCA